MAKKENQRIILTKRLLQEGLLRLLEDKDLEKISVTELCRESGINRATFYNHYCSPQDLLMDMEQQIIDELNTMMCYPRTMEEALDHLEKICTYMQEHARSVIILSRCHADTDLAEVFYKLNQNLLPRKPKSKLTANMDSEDLHLTTTFVQTGSYLLIREWLVRDFQKTPKEIALLLSKIVTTDLIYT